MPTNIEWTDETWNPFTGCKKISPGCANCYAERQSPRFKGRFGYPQDDPFKFTFHESRLNIPGQWKKPKRVFVCSMSDLFYDIHKYEKEIQSVFNSMIRFRKHTYIILTKRADNMFLWFKYHPYDLIGNYPHIWIGVTAENQEMANIRIHYLNQIKAAIKFVSIEPMLSMVDLYEANAFYSGPCGGGGESGPVEYDTTSRINWVICGGEKTRSMKQARAINIKWVRDLRDQCLSVNVPFFFKQWGEWAPRKLFYDCGCEIDNSERMVLMGHKYSGRILDGREWNEFPI